MSFDKIKETASVEAPEEPLTDSWIGNVETDLMELKLSEYEKMNKQSGGLHSIQLHDEDGGLIHAIVDQTPLSEVEIEEWNQLDENTIDSYFLHKAREKDGTDVDAIEESKVCPLSSQQDTNGEYFPDGWKPVELSQGTVLYQLAGEDGTKSSYFTDAATVDSCRDSRTGEVDLNLLKEKLQVNDQDNAKKILTSYLVDNPKGVRAVEGEALSNEHFGKGGGHQYYIPYANELKENNSIARIGDLSKTKTE